MTGGELWDTYDLAGGRDRSAMTARSSPATARPGGAVSPSSPFLPAQRRLVQFLATALLVGAVVAGLMVCFTLGQDRQDRACAAHPEWRNTTACANSPEQP